MIDFQQMIFYNRFFRQIRINLAAKLSLSTKVCHLLFTVKLFIIFSHDFVMFLANLFLGNSY